MRFVAVWKQIAQCHMLAGKAWQRLLMYLHRPLFASHGRNFQFDPYGLYSFHTIAVGDDVSLGSRPCLIAAKSRIQIGNHVMFGPEVTIRGGNHRIDLVGRFMTSVTNEEKRPEDDRGVVIEDDVWVGTRAIILHGVLIGRGSVIGAGAVVTKDVPPYALVVGVPASVVKFRWDVETILRHEAMLYPPEKRLPRDVLTASQEVAARGHSKQG